MTVANPTWADIQSPLFADAANRIICDNPPKGRSVRGITPLPGTTYAVHRVTLDDGSRHVVRIGAVPLDRDTADDGFLGTASVTMKSLRHQKQAALSAHAGGAPVAVPWLVRECDGVEMMWMPFVDDDTSPLTAGQWHGLLQCLPDRRLPGSPVFTHRAQIMEALHGLDQAVAAGLGGRYDLWMETLFEEATRWSMIHGDPTREHVRSGARGGIGANGAIMLSLGAMCWAPAVWDATGVPAEVRGEVMALGGYSPAEIRAALELRRVAADVEAARAGLQQAA